MADIISSSYSPNAALLIETLLPVCAVTACECNKTSFRLDSLETREKGLATGFHNGIRMSRPLQIRDKTL